MTHLIATVLALSSREPVDGYATYYRPGLMRQVADNRGMSLGGHVGGVALNDCADLGRTVWLEFDGAVYGPMLTVDCCQAPHLPERERRGYVVEVDADLARLVGFYGVGPKRVRVLFEKPEGWRAWN